MTIAIRHAWLQKHESPAASQGEFHWYPPDGDRELRSALVERMRGVDPPAVLWELAPGRVSWAQTFAATAPTDGRRYVGLVLTIAEDPVATTMQLLEALELPPAAPWDDAQPERGVAHAVDPWSEAVPTERHGAIDRRAAERDDARPPGAGRGDGAGLGVDAARSDGDHDEQVRISRALLGGGSAIVADPTDGALPRRFAALERWMPEAVLVRARHGMVRSGTVAGGAADRVAALAVAAWREPVSPEARAWTLLAELATARERTVDEIFGEVERAAQPAGGVLSDAERAAVGEARDFAGILHAWGRGRLDRIAGTETLPDRLADAVALRVLACLLGARDPAGAIAEARWHALLPAAQRSMLLDTVARRAASLRSLVEGDHA